MSKEDFESHVSKRITVPVEFGHVHLTFLDIYDPLLLLENTPYSTEKEMNITMSNQNGISIGYSHHKQSPNMELLTLSVTGGYPLIRQEIVRDFSDFLGTAKSRLDWLSISPVTELTERNMYIWEIELHSVL